MNPRFWSFRLFAAFWGILFAPLVPAVAGPRDAAELLPADTLAYLGWSQLFDEDTADTLNKIPDFLAVFDVEPDIVATVEQVIRLVTIAGRSAGGIGLVDLEPAEEGVAVSLQAVVESGAQTPALVDALRALLEQGDEGERVSEVEIAGARFNRVAAKPELLWGAHAGKFILATSPDAVEALVRGEPDRDASLANNATFKSCRAKVGASESSEWKLCAYVDVPVLTASIKRLVAARGTALPPMLDDLLRESGADALRALYLHVDESAYGPVTHLLLRTEGRRTGFLKLWDQQPLANDDLRLVPQDAYWAVVSNWDLGDSWQEARRVVETLDPNAAAQVDGVLARTGATLGFSPTDDLLPALGDTWVIYDGPSHGSYLITGAVLIAEVRQPDALRGAFNRLLGFVRPLLAQKNVKLVTKQVEHRGHTIHYLVAAGLPIPIAPAAAFFGDRVICGLTPQPVKLALDQADPALRHASILDHPDVKRLQDALPTDMQRFSYGDAHYRVGTTYPLMHHLRTAVASMGIDGEGGRDPGDLPTLPETRARTHGTVTTCQVDADGVLYRCHGHPLLPDISATPIAVVALLFSILLPSLSRARELAKRAVSTSNLRGIGMALHIYANDHNEQFPESLQILIDVGCITGEQLNSPRDREGNVSYIYIKGQTEASDARNIVAYERVIGDEGTNALFLDGHVEWLKLDRFKQVLLETYQRLGREDEMPADLQP